MKTRPAEKIFKGSKRILKALLMVVGAMAAVMVILAFTTAPFRAWYGMALKKAGIHRPPDCIVLLGGGGMPSESGLIRLWYTAQAASYYTRAKVVIALPGRSGDSLSSISLMKKELMLRGISSERIFLEDSGTNTRSQALFLLKRISDSACLPDRQGYQKSVIRHPSSVIRNLSIIIITSPEHLLRAVLTFKKAGFQKVDGLPAFERAIESDIVFNARKLGGRKFIPDVGGNIALRYQFWTQMDYEFLVLREWLALGYYKLMGWI